MTKQATQGGGKKRCLLSRSARGKIRRTRGCGDQKVGRGKTEKKEGADPLSVLGLLPYA